MHQLHGREGMIESEIVPKYGPGLTADQVGSL
jgi:hypothetical protein